MNEAILEKKRLWKRWRQRKEKRGEPSFLLPVPFSCLKSLEKAPKSPEVALDIVLTSGLPL
jgi:hypothetical protein